MQAKSEGIRESELGWLRQGEKAKTQLLRETPSWLKSEQELVFEASMQKSSWEEVMKVPPEIEVSQP